MGVERALVVEVVKVVAYMVHVLEIVAVGEAAVAVWTEIRPQTVTTCLRGLRGNVIQFNQHSVLICVLLT